MSRVPPVITYSALRLLLFAVPFGLLLLVGVPVLWALPVAFILSALVSLFALSSQRDAISASVVERSARVKTTMDERAAAEDAWDDEQRAKGEGAQRADDSGS